MALPVGSNGPGTGPPAGLRARFALTLSCAVALIGASPAVGADPGALPTSAELDRATNAWLADSPRPRGLTRQLRSDGAGGTGLPVPPSAGAGNFPDARVVSLYGAPQLGATALGNRRPGAAAKLISRQTAPYGRAGFGDRPAVPAFNLIAVIATADPGSDGLYRSRQPAAVIGRYLEKAREIGGRLVLDIQPGRASVMREIRALRPWLEQPDVDISIDPEWNVGRRGVPGRTSGTIGAEQLNRASALLAKIVAAAKLPPKAMIVHQFHAKSVTKRPRVVQRDRVPTMLNFDGIGAPKPKVAGYLNLRQDGLFDGFSLFYDLDSRVMRPEQVLEIDPAPLYVMYQ